MREKVVILLDGGFVTKRLRRRLGHFPSAEDVVALVAHIMRQPRLEGCDLLRVYYYDAPPLRRKTTNPISGETLNLAATEFARAYEALIDSLELQPDFAVRRGSLIQPGWKLGWKAMDRLCKNKGGEIEAHDLVPDISQKGVDIRIGLDIASVAIKRFASILVLVTGDSDFVPPMKLARKEGMRVYLECLDYGVLPELKVHADFIFEQ